MRWFRKLVFWGVVTGVIAIVAVAALWPQPEAVEVAVVERGWLEVSVQEEGKTRIKDRYVVSAPVTGQLLRIELRPGDKILQGQTLLATIQPGDPGLLDARQISQAKAQVEAAKVHVDRANATKEQAAVAAGLAETTYSRARQLLAEKSISQNEFDQHEAEYRSSRESLRVANFETEIAQFELEQAEAAVRHFTSEDEGDYRFEIRSPIDGQVLKVIQESATVVNSGAPLLEVGNPSDLEVVVDVLSSDAVKIETGDAVELTQWGGERPLLGEVTVVEPSAFTRISSLGVEEQRVNVVADFREPSETLHKLGDGYRVAARVIVWKEPDVLKVPNSALFRVDQKWTVFVVRNGRAVETPIVIGQRNEFHSQVLDGLSVGDPVVIYPSDLVHDGTSVSVKLPSP